MIKLEKNNSSNLNVWILIAIILCGFALYIPSLKSTSFYDDDHICIEHNEAIKGIDILKIFNTFNSRSLVGLSFALNYKLCALHPVGYRLINLLIHCLNAFLVYLLIKSTLYLYPAQKPIIFCRLEWPAFFASMLFLCHPIQTEPVNFITQRFVLMGTFFYLLTLFLYIQYRCRSKKRYMLASMGAAIAAMFCKEFVVTLPLMLALYDVYFLHNETIWKRCKSLLPFLGIVLIVPLLLLRTPRATIEVANIANSDFVQGYSTQGFENHVDITKARYSIGRKPYFLTELNVMCTYVRLLFLPIHQNFSYDYPFTYVMDVKTLMSGVFLLCLLVLAAVTYRPYRFISFSILWFFIALSVESSFIPIGDVITEYRLYLASVGFVFLVTALIFMRQADQKKLSIIAVAILIGFSVLTYQRNKIWKDEISLLDDTIQKSPHIPNLYINRGMAYARQGNFPQAILDLNKAIEINPKYLKTYYNRELVYHKAYNNLGVIYSNQGNFTRAISDFNKIIEMDPRFVAAYYNRGLIYAKQGNITQAISDYNKTIEIDPKYVDAYNNRGIIYGNQGNFTQAMSDFNKAIEINPNHDAEIYNNRGLLYAKEGNLIQALADYNKAIEIDPNYTLAYSNRALIHINRDNFTQIRSDYSKATAQVMSENKTADELGRAEAYYNRGVNYGNQGRDTEAISDFTKAIEMNPKYLETYSNRGNIYDKQGNFIQAISDYSKAIEINPHSAIPYNNRGVDYFKQGNLVQAISDYNKAIEINPEFADAYNNRANASFTQGNLTQAMSDYNKAIEINPKYVDAYCNRAILYYQLKRYDDAWADVHTVEGLGYAVNPPQLLEDLKKASGMANS